MVLTVQDDGTLEFDIRLRFYLEQGKAAEAKRLLMGSAVDFCKLADSSGSTLLHYSARCNNEQMLDYLIQCGSKVDAKDNEGFTPLMLAIQTKHRRTIKKLLLAGANIYIKNDNGDSCLRLLFRSLSGVHKFGADKKLLEMFFNNLKVDCKNDNEIAELLFQGNCPLYYVVFLKKASVVKILLRKLSRDAIDACEEPTIYNALYFAVELQDVATVKMLIDRGAFEKSRHPVYMIHECCICGMNTPENIEILEILLQRIDPRVMEKELLSSTTLRTLDRERVKILARYIDFRADFHTYTLMHDIARNPNPNVTDGLKHVIYDYNNKYIEGSTVLCYATLVSGNPSTVKFILNKKVDVNNVDICGMSPLLCVFYNVHGHVKNSVNDKNYMKIIYNLLEFGADVQIIDNDQKSLFSQAISRRHFNLVRPVLAHLALQEVVGIPIKPLIKETVASHSMLARHYNICKLHLSKMKHVVVVGRVSLYTLLTESDEKVVIYVQNPEFAKRFNAVIRRRRSNKYYNFILRRKITKMIRVAEIQIGAANVLGEILKAQTARRDDISLRKIISYLSTDDCESLRDAV